MNRRSFLAGLIAAPVIVRSASLMQVRGVVMPPTRAIDIPGWRHGWVEYTNGFWATVPGRGRLWFPVTPFMESIGVQGEPYPGTSP